MNKLINYIFTFLLFGACSSFTDESKLEIQNFNTLTVENIDTDLKVINLEVDQDEFDEMYENFEDEIEIDGYLNVYKNNEITIRSERVEIEIKGTVSASLKLKSLGIKFDDAYENKENDFKLINPDLLPHHSVDKIKSIRLRNSGNDFKETMVKDMIYTKLAINADLNLDLMYAEQVVVFVNNRFLGLLNLRTEKNANGISRLYGVKKKQITIAKVNGQGELELKDGDFDKIRTLIDAIDQKEYEFLIHEIDVDNFIDYMVFQTYISNSDWPHNNVIFFAIDDEPFKFFIYDLDLCNIWNIDKSPLFFIHSQFKNPISELFDVLYANNVFKLKYDLRWNYLIESGLLSANNFDEIVNQYKKNIEQIMPMQIEKYGFPGSITNWYIYFDHIKFNFREREKYVK